MAARNYLVETIKMITKLLKKIQYTVKVTIARCQDKP